MSFNKLTAYTQKVADAADQLVGNPSATKAIFDAAPEEIRTYFNNLVDALKSTTSGDSGAKNLGVTAITGLTGTDVQTLLEGLKSSDDKKIATGSAGYRMEICTALFFTNGGSNSATATVTFGQPFTSTPTVMPADMYQKQSYGDTIRFPDITATETGFTVKITTGDTSNLGTVGNPANIGMHFVAFGH